MVYEKSPKSGKRIQSKEIADCRVFGVREDSCVNSQTNKKASFFVIKCADWVNIIPVNQKGEVLLIEQFRTWG